MIRENAPNVKKLSGRESVERTGFTEPLIKPITKAAIKAAGKLAMSTSGTTKSTINSLMREYFFTCKSLINYE